MNTRTPLVLKTANSTSWSHIYSFCCHSLNVLVEVCLVSLTTKIPPHPNWWHNNPTGALTCPLFILYIWRTIRTHSTKSWKTATRCLKPFQTNIGNDKGAEIKKNVISDANNLLKFQIGSYRPPPWAIGPLAIKTSRLIYDNRCLVVRPPRQASIRLMQILLWAPELPPYLLVWLGRLLHIGRGPTSPCWTWNIFGTWVGRQKILALRSISKNIGKFERCWRIHVNYTCPYFIKK